MARRRTSQIRLIVALIAVAALAAVYALEALRPPPEPGSCFGTARCFDGTVENIVDGDTLDIGGERIRLALVNSPESGEAGYAEATAFTAGVCPVGSTATVDEDDGQTEGSFGRIIAVVTCGGTNLNAALLDAGHATVLTSFCDDSEFSRDAWAAPHC